MIKNMFSQTAAEILIDIDVISIQTDTPFTLTSGRKSPVYVDCRKIISFPKERKKLMEMAVEILGSENSSFDAIAGGETAGIPFAAWISELMQLPMLYVRKKPKGFGQNKQIEGVIKSGQNVLLVEDLATDGGSKMSFINAIRNTGANCHTCFVIFHYGIFQQSLKNLEEQNVSLIELATWKDILEVFRKRGIKKNKIDDIERYLENPDKWEPNK